jgi:peroxiredoxin
MFHRVFATIALGIALALSLLMWPTRVPASTTDSDLRKAAPDFTLNDSKGFPLKLRDYKGRVVLLDFWATWCHGCKIEIPWYMEFQRKYKGRGLAVIGVSMDDDGWKSVRPFLREHQFNYPVVIGNQYLAKVYGVDSMPVTLLIDRQGKTADSHSGVVNKDGFEREIQTLLQERAK